MLRHEIAARAPDGHDDDGDDADAVGIGRWFKSFFERLRGRCAEMSGPELTSLDGMLERSLYDIDRADIQAVTDGSDDGCLYARGFVVALGREYYNAVHADPRLAVVGAGCEQRCFFFGCLHQKRFVA